MLKNAETYEIMKPEDVGIRQSTLVLGKHSGRHALRERIRELGYHIDDLQLSRVFEDFKLLAEKKKEVYDADIEALVEGRIHEGGGPWEIVAVQTNAGTGTLPTAAVCLQHADGNRVQEAATGDGPIDAALKAIERIVGIDVRLVNYQVRSVSMGKDAQGEVALEIEHLGKTYRSRATSTDIVEASARAFLTVLNQLALEKSNVDAVLSGVSRRD
jgi:2-isopropylmalate synthase